MFVEHGIDDLGLHIGGLICFCKKYKVSGVFGDRFVDVKLFDDLEVVFDFNKFDEGVLDLPAVKPDIHHHKQQTTKQEGEPSTVDKLIEIGYQKRPFNEQVNRQKEPDQVDRHFLFEQVDA